MSTAATPSGKCYRCGGQLYENLVHHCQTAAAVTGKPWADKPREGDPVPGGMTEAVTGQPLSEDRFDVVDAPDGEKAIVERQPVPTLWELANAEIDRLRAALAQAEQERDEARASKISAWTSLEVLEDKYADQRDELAAVRERLRQTREAGDALYDALARALSPEPIPSDPIELDVRRMLVARATSGWRALRGGQKQTYRAATTARTGWGAGGQEQSLTDRQIQGFGAWMYTGGAFCGFGIAVACHYLFGWFS